VQHGLFSSSWNRGNDFTLSGQAGHKITPLSPGTIIDSACRRPINDFLVAYRKNKNASLFSVFRLNDQFKSLVGKKAKTGFDEHLFVIYIRGNRVINQVLGCIKSKASGHYWIWSQDIFLSFSQVSYKIKLFSLILSIVGNKWSLLDYENTLIGILLMAPKI
jgi:hypothetical protein